MERRRRRAQETAIILDVPDGFCAVITSGAACDADTTYDSLQLVIPASGEDRVRKGECVRAAGPLFRAFTGHHRREIVMRVTELGPCKES